MAAVAFKVTPLVFVRKFGDFSDLRSYPFSEILIKKKIKLVLCFMKMQF